MHFKGDFSRLYRAVKKSPTSIEFVKDNKYEHQNPDFATTSVFSADFTN
jgi:hypothetical protein